MTYILYHKNCADGTASALAAYLYFRDKATYIPVQYQEDPPQLELGRKVYLVDFSYPREVLDQLTQNHQVIVLDHHKTAKETLMGYGNLSDKVFDMERSGAMITWNYFHPTKPVPDLFYYIQDRDLWQWIYDETKPISAYLVTVGFNEFRKWLPFLEKENLEPILEKGRAICSYQDRCVEIQVKQFYLGNLPDSNKIWMTNCSHLISETCSAFLEQNTVGAEVCCCWFNVGGSKVVYSLRGNGKFDCSELAKRFNGGGHYSSSGFSYFL